MNAIRTTLAALGLALGLVAGGAAPALADDNDRHFAPTHRPHWGHYYPRPYYPPYYGHWNRRDYVRWICRDRDRDGDRDCPWERERRHYGNPAPWGPYYYGRPVPPVVYTPGRGSIGLRYDF